MNHSQTRLVSLLVLAGLVLGACTTNKQETPPLSGPSELSTAISVAVSPDVVTQDGVSQSLVSISARDANGQPLRNTSLRAEISVSGVGVDFGKLSAKSVVTDNSGTATLVFTAPPPASGPVPPTDVQIRVTPIGSDFANASARWATIHVVPGGTTVPPRGAVTPDFTFTPSSPADNEAVLFDASASKSATGTIVQWLWNFDDGTTGSGEQVTHTFRSPGSKSVTLTVIDSIGASNSISKNVTIGQGTLPTVTILSSPASPIVGQTINFNGSTSKPAPGRTIRNYDWDFGDGSRAGGATVQHAYDSPGTYIVVLTVTDDAGRVGTSTASVTVSTDEPTASFTMTPNPASGTNGSDVLVFFDASASVAKGNRTITSYTWTFTNSTTAASGRTTSRPFRAPGTYQITLTVTDSAGKTGTTTQTLTVTGT
jgi:PKD repeat protein